MPWHSLCVWSEGGGDGWITNRGMTWTCILDTWTLSDLCISGREREEIMGRTIQTNPWISKFIQETLHETEFFCSVLSLKKWNHLHFLFYYHKHQSLFFFSHLPGYLGDSKSSHDNVLDLDRRTKNTEVCQGRWRGGLSFFDICVSYVAASIP